MDPMMEIKSDIGTPIQEFYRDKNVFLTGGTGFLGKVLTEKLLRSCPNIGQIYLLVRAKKDMDIQQRLDTIFKEPLFSKISDKKRNKVEAIEGDCSLPGLGLSEFSRQLLRDKTNIVIHAAATVRFDEALPLAVSINVAGTKEILQVAREMSNLKAFVHVSTAFTHCHLKNIDEKFYDPPIKAENLMQLTACLDKEMCEKFTPVLLDDRPNTYVYTKSVAEDVVKEHSKGLPITIFRPAIVVATNDEPIAGWIDNMYGATGVMVGCGTGVLRTLHCDEDVMANIVPVDLSCNAIIASAWSIAERHTTDTNHNNQDLSKEADAACEPPIYNYVSTVEKPITWAKFTELSFKHGLKIPPSQLMWYYCLTLHKTAIMNRICVFLLHLFPALVLDFFAKLTGKPAQMMKLYRKINKFADVIAYFGTRNWNFNNDNVQQLWRRLDPKDQEIFPFSMANIYWDDFFYKYVRGVRLYILKDDPSNIPQSLVKLNRFYWMHQVVKFVFGLCMLRLGWFGITLTYRIIMMLV